MARSTSRHRTTRTRVLADRDALDLALKSWRPSIGRWSSCTTTWACRFPKRLPRSASRLGPRNPACIARCARCARPSAVDDRRPRARQGRPGMTASDRFDQLLRASPRGPGRIPTTPTTSMTSSTWPRAARSARPGRSWKGGFTWTPRPGEPSSPRRSRSGRWDLILVIIALLIAAAAVVVIGSQPSNVAGAALRPGRQRPGRLRSDGDVFVRDMHGGPARNARRDR